tara:strand:- start:2474 stop:4588 length:2115 start_codon:yes stop_codon:yes gene_type:complete
MNEYDKLADAVETPDIGELQREYHRSIDDGYSMQRMSDNDDVRFARWNSQSSDGKKHSSNLDQGKQAFPFEGANDGRIFHTDDLINTQVDILQTAFKRAQLKLGGSEVNDLPVAQTATTLMKWLIGTKMRHDLLSESELLAQFGQQYGYGILFVGWEQENGLRQMEITMEEIVAMAEQVEGQSILAELPEMIQDPEREDGAIDIITGQLENISRPKARDMIRELRDTGATKIPVPYLAKNRPVCTSLKPLEDVSFPPETVNIQDARCIFRRVFLTAVQVREKIKSEEWNEDFVEAVLKTQGSSTNYNDVQTSISGLKVSDGLIVRDNLVEIVYAYTKSIDENNNIGIYCTVFSPLLSHNAGTDPLFAKHLHVDYAHNKYPFVLYKRENVRRQITESRGIPEISKTQQSELKSQHDSVYDFTSFSTIPPLAVNRRMGQIKKYGPGAQIMVTRPDDVQHLDGPKKDPAVAFKLIEEVKAQADKYFGFPNVQLPPAVSQVKQQRVVNSWLNVWQEAYQQILCLAVQYMSPEEIHRVTGSQMPLDMNVNDYDIILRFDVAEALDAEGVEKRLSAIAQYVVPQDMAGVIDRAKLIEFQTRAIAPEYADDLIVPQEQATVKMKDQVKTAVSQMMNGIEPEYNQEVDPAAGNKLGMLENIVQNNPKLQEQLQGDQLLQKMLEAYQQNLQFSVQQQENAQIGKMGMSPVTGQ